MVVHVYYQLQSPTECKQRGTGRADAQMRAYLTDLMSRSSFSSSSSTWSSSGSMKAMPAAASAACTHGVVRWVVWVGECDCCTEARRHTARQGAHARGRE